jgi:hypothetical protein
MKRMKKMVLLSIITLLFALPTIGVAQENRGSDDAAIRQIIQYYVEGWKYNNVESIKKAFHPKARLYFQTTGGEKALAETTGERFFTTVERNGLSKDPKPFSSKIISVDVTGNAAIAKVEFDWHGVWFMGNRTSLLEPPPGAVETRYLSLIKFSDNWKIVSDVSTVREGK